MGFFGKITLFKQNENRKQRENESKTPKKYFCTDITFKIVFFQQYILYLYILK